MRRRVGTAKHDRSILVAVSGGPDSVALLVALTRISRRLDLRLEVATLDHGLRAESAAEAKAVLALAAELGVPAEAAALGLIDGSALEARARETRYAALEGIRLQRGLALIATGHTASDQAETVLMRLARGAALGGAAGILERTPQLIRPLLDLTRADVAAYLAALGRVAVKDPMNADPKFLRVRVRRQLLPLYEETAGPRVAEHLARFAGYAAEDDALLDRHATAALERIREGERLDSLALQALERPIARRVIARWLAGHSVEMDSPLLEDALEAIAHCRPATLPNDRMLVTVEGWLTVTPAPPKAKPSRNFMDQAGVGDDDGL